MADTKVSALTELAATPATGDELYIRDISEAASAESKRITIANLMEFAAADTITFTNKTLDASGTGNVITNVGASEIEIGLITGHSELSAGPVATDEVLISDAGTFKKINASELLNPENFTELAAAPATSDEFFINDGGVGKKITWSNLFLDADLPGTLDVTGAATLDSTLAVAGTATLSGAVSVASVNGINYTPGSDVDVDIFTIDVTGAPNMLWDESADRFLYNKGIRLTGNVELQNNFNLRLGSSSEYLMKYESTPNYLSLRTTDSDGGGTDADVWRIPDGQLSIDANTTWDDNVFDDYDDALVLQDALKPHKPNRELLIEMGVLKRYKDGWVGYNDQRMAALLAGGIYQNRAKIDDLYIRLEALEAN